MNNHPEVDEYEKLIVECAENGVVWARKKAIYNYAEKAIKSQLAEISSHQEGSESAKQRLALASSEYKEILKKLKNIEQDFLIAQIKYEEYKQLVDKQRTVVSLLKEELRNLKG